MSDRGAELLRAVLAAPDEDAPRLVYADYLMEKGDQRGELISVQVQLAQRINPARRARAKRRERELLYKHKRDIQASLGVTTWSMTLRRGFVDEIRSDADSFAGAAKQLLEREPVRRVRLWRTETRHLEKLLADGVIGKLSTLMVYGDVDTAAVRALAASDQLASLERLNLVIGMDDEAAIALLTSPHLRARALGLHDNASSDAMVEALVAWPGLERCTHLYLARNRLTDDGAKKLARAHMPAMRKLVLSGNQGLGDAGALAFATPEHAAMIARIDLWDLDLSAETHTRLREHWGERVLLTDD